MEDGEEEEEEEGRGNLARVLLLEGREETG